MAFMDWKEQFSVGILAIDEQHRRLLDIINRLHDAMKKGSDVASLDAVVRELISYTRYHFAFEEQMLERAAYPELEEHRRKHRAMVVQVERFRDEVASGKAMMPLKLMNFLKDWLSKHILQTDMRYGRHLAQSKVA